ncbi:interleukin-4 receptor subunit alpha [Cynocephalus volans]|uniref:interleukin-4 receptor subunit alpha n=1 Tax=Cynocephalus volans TaxID=110931 RepID=UPI002FCBF505
MGWLCSGLLFPVSCLILMWVSGSGSIKVLHEPTCFSDYFNISTCEWKMDRPTNCNAELRLFYQLDFVISENHTCVPENSEGTACVCNMIIDDLVGADIYTLDLWAGQQLLWRGSFSPSNHVKPRAPGNLTVHTSVSDTLLLTWSNPYPPGSMLYNDLTYLVNISRENDPADFKIYNVTYREPTLRLPASTLKSGVFYVAQVKALSQRYESTWSEWSPSARWHNSYTWPLKQRLLVGVSISCIIILVICLSCYFSIVKIKKEWWDRIPTPAHSPIMAIVIQDSQVSLWKRQSQAQEPAKCPHWKTCLTKLLPCLLGHDMKRGEDPPTAARNGPFKTTGKSAWHPVEVSRTVLWPEIISVERCVELLEVPVESEEEMEEDKGSFCASPESSGSTFQEGREGIVARMTESLFLDLLGGAAGGFCQQGMRKSCLLPPSGSMSAEMLWAECPSARPKEACSQGMEQPSRLEPNPAASWSQGPATLVCTEMPVITTDNPAYRSFSTFPNQSPSPGEFDPDLQLAECLEEVYPNTPCAPQPSELTTEPQPEPETWEQILRQSVLQHRVATAPASAPASSYREFVHTLKHSSTQDSGVAGCESSGEAGYKAFLSPLASSTVSPGTSGLGASSGDGGYKPFQSLIPSCSRDPAPVPVSLFTFGLDVEPPHSPQHSPLPSSSPEHLNLELAVKGEDRQKPPFAPEQVTDPLRDDLGSGIVYSALTCHLCGHLKQCHGQEEGGQAHVMASPCCGCCCGDRSSPPRSPLRAPDPFPGGVPLEASLSPALLVPLGISEESKSSLSFQPAPSNAQSSSQTPKIVDLVSTVPTCTRVS